MNPVGDTRRWRTVPDYLPEDGNPNWWEAGPYPPPIHQPFRKVLSAEDGIVREAQECVALAGLRCEKERRALLTQMTEIAHHVGGYRFQTALRRLRELG